MVLSLNFRGVSLEWEIWGGATSGSAIGFRIRMGGGERSEPPHSRLTGKVGGGINFYTITNLNQDDGGCPTTLPQHQGWWSNAEPALTFP